MRIHQDLADTIGNTPLLKLKTASEITGCTILAVKGRYEVHMTRVSDVFVSLDRRLAVSRRTGASLFISIHADAVGAQEFARSVRGATVYTPPGRASGKGYRWIAD